MKHLRKIALLSTAMSPLLLAAPMPANAEPPIRLAQEGAPGAAPSAPPSQEKKKEEEGRPAPPQRPAAPPAAAPRPAPPAPPAAAPPAPQAPSQAPGEGAPRRQPQAAPQPSQSPAPPQTREQRGPRPQEIEPAPQPQPQQQIQPAPQPRGERSSPRPEGTPSAAPQTQSRDPRERRPATAAPLPPPPALPNAAPINPAQRSEGPRNLRDFREQRREVQQNGRTIITEPGRVIVRDGGQTIIRHNEVDRFRYGARDVQVRPGRDSTRTVIVRPDGSQIVNITTPDGRLLRRVRRLPDGREIIIIDNAPRGRSTIGGYFLDIAPPVVRIPRERYVVEAEEADEALIYETLMAPPVMALERPYSLDEVRYNYPLLERMRRVDLNTITFDTGSWDVTPEQGRRLGVIADAISRAIERNPAEVFLIEGHTDAVGADIDNLSLSDRRAESVAEVLAQEFGVPPENLVTQGYGEQYLKVPTDGPERANRRVTVRRITPLLAGGNPPPR